MRRVVLTIFAIVMLMNLAVYGQSLGEIARQNREKQNSQETPGVPSKVITNQDLGEGPDGRPELREADKHSPANSKAVDRHPAEFGHDLQAQRMEEQRAEHWKSLILDQQSRIADIQSRIDQLNASIRFSGGTVEYEGAYTHDQARQRLRVAEMQERLDEQRRRLQQLQEAARRAGMHTAVYDP